MNWVKYDGQKLNVGDLLWLELGKLAFVNGDVANEPTTISSIPEAFDFDLNVKYKNIQSGLNFKGEMYDILGNYVDKILLYSPYPEPAEKRLNDLKGRGDHDYVEITFYKDGGKMAYVEYLLIPIFLDEQELIKILVEKFYDAVYYNDIVIRGEYYDRLIKKQ